jgi:cell division protein FtsL
LEAEMFKLLAIIIVVVLAVAIMILSKQIKKKKSYETLGDWNKRNK